MAKPVCVEDYRKQAERVLPRYALDYFRSGAGRERTLRSSGAAFSRLRIRPRCLRNVLNRDLRGDALGFKTTIPVGIAPTAMQKLAHPEGECANAKAAELFGTIFIQSTISTCTIEEVAQSAPNCVKWFQLYIYKDRDVTIELIRRAERAGFKALVLTIDTPFFGIRLADMRNKFSLPPHLTMANFSGLKATAIHESKGGSGINEYVSSLFDSSLSWEDVKWLHTVTKLPIILKGVLTAEDARLARDVGAAAIIVSNHGARQVDDTPTTIEALPEVIEAVGKDLEVYLDGGIRDGTDIFKALALGAKMVFIGRPAIWGLIHNGTAGVKDVLNILKVEFDSTMAMAGCSSIKDIEKTMVVHENYYHKL